MEAYRNDYRNRLGGLPGSAGLLAGAGAVRVSFLKIP